MTWQKLSGSPQYIYKLQSSHSIRIRVSATRQMFLQYIYKLHSKVVSKRSPRDVSATRQDVCPSPTGARYELGLTDCGMREDGGRDGLWSCLEYFWFPGGSEILICSVQLASFYGLKQADTSLSKLLKIRANF